ncbi:MAG: hypothetical protein EA402_09080 [Planctomycetota bacterium]|nr:MAG: hypothetical protein EA402_09080 [Planctomycetota bacterium]
MKSKLREELDALRWSLGLALGPKTGRSPKLRTRAGCGRCKGACGAGGCARRRRAMKAAAEASAVVTPPESPR